MGWQNQIDNVTICCVFSIEAFMASPLGFSIV